VPERFGADCGVGVVGVVKKRSSTDRSVTDAFNVVKKGERAIGCVLVAEGVAEKRPGANGRIFVCGVRQEHPGSDTSVKVGLAVA
jgi:hypothetical protein